MIAGIFGTIATLISFLLGHFVLAWEPRRVLWAIFASNAAVFVSLPSVLYLERVSWFKRRVIPGGLRTWLLYAGAFLFVQMGLTPELREPKAFLLMELPLIFTTGFVIVMYGPIHDFFIRRAQVRALEKARAARARGEIVPNTNVRQIGPD